MTRRALFGVLGGLAAAAVAACKTTTNVVVDASPDAPPGCGSSDAKTVIADNHEHAKHVLIVASADVQAGVDKTYNIMGMAGHDHTVTITAAQFALLAQGGTIMATSTFCMPDGACVADHDHVCTISCG